MKNKFRLGVLFLLTQFLLLPITQAAQTGEVIVEEAQVYQYPQAGSKVIGRLKRAQTVPVSNLPTEGFYKTRLSNGETGWLSGNDILAGTAARPASSTATPRMRKKPPQSRITPIEQDDGGESEDPSSTEGDHTRILVGFGMQTLSFSGLSSNYEKTELLNPGTQLGLELQFRLSSWLHWAARVDALFGKTGDQVLTNGAAQTMSYTNIPAQLGLVMTLVRSESIRLSLGAYAGASVVSSIAINQVTSTTTGDITYSSIDPCGLASAQIAYAFGRKFSLFAEGAYRYQQTAELPATTTFGNIPAFKIDYSGLVGRVGIELRL